MVYSRFFKQHKSRALSKGTVTLCLFLYTLFMALPYAMAATAYIKPVITNRPLWSDSAFYLNFEIDEELCRKAYGKKWKKECEVTLGESNKYISDSSIVAPNWPEGRWSWYDEDSLRFQPSESWKSDTTYNIDISRLPLPSRVELSAKALSFQSIPRSAQMFSPDMWIDPSPKAEHAVSFSMRFTESLSAATRAQLENSANPTAYSDSGLTLSKGKWIWLNDNTRAVVTARILNMPKGRTTATLILPSIRPLWEEDDAWHFPDRDAVQQLVVPGTDSIFTLKEVEMETVQNKALQMEQHIVFRFSQRVNPEEFLKALTVVELPLQRSEENIIDSNWTQGNISPENLKKARPVLVQMASLPDERADFLRYRINATPGHYILWSVAAGFGPTNAQGIHTPLERKAEGVEYVSTGEPRLELLQAGNVLLQQSDIALMSEHVDSIRWSAYRFLDSSLALPFIDSLDDSLPSKILNTHTTAVHGEFHISNATADAKNDGFTHKPTYSILKAKDIFGTSKKEAKPGVVYLVLEGIQDGRPVAIAKRILMYSNMGLVVKNQADDSMHAYISTLNDAKALSGVRVQVLGNNGLPVAESSTNSEGKATFPSLAHLKNEKRPVAVVARHSSWGDEDMIWMSLTDYERRVNTSRFADMEGSQSSTNSLNAFVFSERGLFRPGEDMHFGVLLRANNWSLLPSTMPLVATLDDESGRTVLQQSFTAGDSIHSISWPIPESAMTGNYKLTISTPADAGDDDGIGLVLGFKEVRVATFLPDTLRIKTEILNTDGTDSTPSRFTKGWLVTSPQEKGSSLRVHLSTLFGQVATGRRVETNMRLSRARLSFPGYEAFTFQDVSPFFTDSSDSIERTLAEAITNAQGQATLPLDFSQWRFGTLQCLLTTEGYEPGGGRSVSQYDSFLLSPLPYMLGYKTGQGLDNKNFIIKDSASQLDFQMVDSKLKPINPANLTFVIARRQMVTSLVTDSDGEYTYTQTPLDTVFTQNEQKLNDKGHLQWNIPTQEVGEYLLTVKVGKATGQNPSVGTPLAEGTVLANITFSVVGNDDLRPALERASNLPEAKLLVKADKKEYNGGDTAKLMINTPYDGVALITLERDSVVAHKWVKLHTGSNLQDFAIPKSFTGRGYVQVLMARAPQSEHIFLQPQSVAMVPINVNTAQRTVDINLIAAEKSLPGTPLKWRIENNHGKATKAILFAVDEGILQLSKFKTPDPLQYLLLDRALEVSTAQLFDRIMPEHEHIMRRLSAFGGDGGENDMFAGLLGTFQNPFKRTLEPPVVWWSGVIDVPAAGLEGELPIPSYYNGKVRLMAILHNAEAVGSAEAGVIIQGEQVLTPQLPTMAALGDSFEAGLGIMNTTDEAVTLEVAMELDSQSTTQDIRFAALPQSIKLGPKDEKFLPFRVVVGQVPGNAVLRFTTSTSDGKKTERTTSFSVRPAVLPRYSQQTMLLKQPAVLQSQRSLLPYDAQTSLTVSATPLPLLRSSLNYLENYPYDCVEQTLSKAFPLVSMHGTPLATLLEKNRLLPSTEKKQKTLKDAYNALLSSFNSYWGVSLWTDASDFDLFLTAYAADYILALRDAQLPVPPGLVPAIFTTLESEINSRPSNVHELRAMAYATWVLARAGYVVSKPLELCESFIKDYDLHDSDVFHTLMAGAYAALYMQPEAEEHLAKVRGTAPQTWTDPSYMFDLLAQYGLHLQVLAKHFPQEFQEAVPHMQGLFLEGLNKPHATLGASMAALGLASIIHATPNNAQDAPSIQMHCRGYEANHTPATAPVPHILSGISLLEAPMCTNFEISLPQNTQAFAQIENYGYDSTLPKESLSQNLKVEKTISFANGDEFTGTVVQGDVLRVDVTTTVLSDDEIYVAMVDLLPGGFELVLEHPDDTRANESDVLNREEDRVVAFFSTNNDSYTVTYHILATHKGQFTLPASHAEGIFDRSLQAHTASSHVTVVAY